MIFGFFVCAADAAGPCALAVSAAAAAAVVPNMNSRRFVGNAKLPSQYYGRLPVKGIPYSQTYKLPRCYPFTGRFVGGPKLVNSPWPRYSLGYRERKTMRGNMTRREALKLGTGTAISAATSPLLSSSI